MKISVSRADLEHFRPSTPALIGWLGLLAAFLVVYGSPLVDLTRLWWRDPDYGHGFFVKPFAIFLLLYRRELATPLPSRGSWWCVPCFLVGALLYWASEVLMYDTAIYYSLIPCVAGIVLLAGGWQAMRWAWPSVLFLVFMLPLPGSVAGMLRLPLQVFATKASVFVIQTLGIPSISHGNVIELTNGPIGVVEACSGLRMLMLFFAICVGAVFVLKRPLWEKAIIVLSAVPIAILCNVTRITVTAVLHEYVSSEVADVVFHNMAGLLMMPLALLLLWGELALLARLFPEPADQGSPRLGGLGLETIGGAQMDHGNPHARRSS